jgi:hypothetical protein
LEIGFLIIVAFLSHLAFAFEKDFSMQGKNKVLLSGIVLAAVALAPALGRAESLPTALLLYTFDSTSSVSGSTVVANSGSLGTAGSATLSTSGASIVSDSTAPFLGKALSISGSGVMSTAANIISTSDLNNVTISAWIKASSIGTWNGLFGYYHVASTNYCDGWSVQTSSSAATAGDVQARLWGASSGSSSGAWLSQLSTSSSTSVKAVSTSWQQLTITMSGLTDTTANHTLSINFYVNGQLLTSYSMATSSTISTNNLQFLLGKVNWDSLLTAEYGYVALYDSALNDAQVQMLYNTSIGAAVPEPAATVLTIIGVGGLLAYAWRKRRN